MFRVTQWEARTLRWWLSQYSKIDMDPPYQRKGQIWSKGAKQYLVDSVLNDYDIPKIYIADFTYAGSPLNVKNLPFAIIDGKQRFEALLEFSSNKFELRNDIIFDEDPTLNLAGLKYEDLKTKHSDIADKFDNFNLTVMRVVTHDEARINDLFVRLNSSKPLTGVEVRNAMAGPISSLSRKIAEHEFFSSRVRFSTQRQEHVNTAYKLLLLEFRGRLVDTKKVNLDRFVEEGKKAELSELDRSAARADQVLTSMCSIFEPRDALLTGSGVVPVYYWFVRSLDANRLSSAGTFLAEFNWALKNDPPPGSVFDRYSQEMNSYKLLSRSQNDQASLDSRFKILVQLFDKWSGQKQLARRGEFGDNRG